MGEYTREIRGGLYIDTNKQTHETQIDGESVVEVLALLKEWAIERDLMPDDRVAANPDTPDPAPSRYLTGARTFARRIGACPRCRRPVEAVLTVEVKVDLNEMYWNERGDRPSVGASSKIVKTETLHQCGDEEDGEDD